MKKPSDFAKELCRYFKVYLTSQRGCSPETIATYRQAFILFLEFMEKAQGKKPERIEMADFTIGTVNSYLDWLEKEKACSTSTRNLRLAVLRSFASFIRYDYPSHLEECMKVLSIKAKKNAKGDMVYLKLDGVKLLLEQPDLQTQSGRRDYLMMALMYSTGMRVSEVIGIRVKDLALSEPRTLKIYGKGSKVRFVPILKYVVKPLKAYLKETGLDSNDRMNELLFLNHLGTQFTRQGISHIISKYADMARTKEPRLIPESIGCHSIRHSTAMSLVNSGVDLIYIRDLLGHASVQTTEVYARADSEAKRKAIEAVAKDFVPNEHASWETEKSIMKWLQELEGKNVL